MAHAVTDATPAAETTTGRGSRGRPKPPRTNKMGFSRWFAEIGWRHLIGVLAVLWALFPVSYILSASLNLSLIHI